MLNDCRIRMSAAIRISPGAKHRISVDDPTWLYVTQWLDAAYESGGNISLEFDRKIEEGRLWRCSMRAEPRKFLLTALIYGDTGDVVISWQNQEGLFESGKVDIAGDDWDARWVQTDISIAINVFKEFFETGELSTETLQHMR
jgi:hypothetical protein